MSYFLVKTLLAVLFIAAGLTAALSMLTLMGKSEKRMSVKALRSTHHIAGWIFTVLLVVLAVMGLWYLRAAGDTLPLRGVLHWTLGALLGFMLLLKLVVVRFFKQFLKFAPVMGMAIIVLALVVATLSAVFFVVTKAGRTISTADIEEVDEQSEPAVTAEPVVTAEPAEEPIEDPVPDEEPEVDEIEEPAPSVADEPLGDAAAGVEIYRTNCMACHHADSTDNKIGPGLAGLFARDKLALGDRPVTRETVRAQIESPLGTMPGFEGYLSEEQLDDLVAYLETL